MDEWMKKQSRLFKERFWLQTKQNTREYFAMQAKCVCLCLNKLKVWFSDNFLTQTDFTCCSSPHWLGNVRTCSQVWREMWSQPVLRLKLINAELCVEMTVRQLGARFLSCDCLINVGPDVTPRILAKPNILSTGQLCTKCNQAYQELQTVAHFFAFSL